MKLIRQFLNTFFDSEMKLEYTLEDGTSIKVGRQKFKNKYFPIEFVGQIGKVSIKVNSEKISCPIHREKDGKIVFIFRDEKIPFDHLKHVDAMEGEPKKRMYIRL